MWIKLEYGHIFVRPIFGDGPDILIDTACDTGNRSGVLKDIQVYHHEFTPTAFTTAYLQNLSSMNMKF